MFSACLQLGQFAGGLQLIDQSDDVPKKSSQSAARGRLPPPPKLVEQLIVAQHWPVAHLANLENTHKFNRELSGTKLAKGF